VVARSDRRPGLPTAQQPVQVLGLLHHLSQKHCIDQEPVMALFIHHAIERIADAMEWKIHPF
jgi:hypothetical protein